MYICQTNDMPCSSGRTRWASSWHLSFHHLRIIESSKLRRPPCEHREHINLLFLFLYVNNFNSGVRVENRLNLGRITSTLLLYDNNNKKFGTWRGGNIPACPPPLATRLWTPNKHEWIMSRHFQGGSRGSFRDILIWLFFSYLFYVSNFMASFVYDCT